VRGIGVIGKTLLAVLVMMVVVVVLSLFEFESSMLEVCEEHRNHKSGT